MSKQKFKKNKRTFIKGFLSLLLLKNLYPLHSYADEENTYLLKGPLAGAFYYTKDKSGRWEKLKESHITSYEINNEILEITTLHEMRGYDHYIIKHILLDKKFNLISEKIFDPSRDTPISKHNITGFTEKLYVLSICNKHDTWLNIIKL